MRKLTTIIGVLACYLLHAAPYFNERMELNQPDGTAVEVILNGDEYFMHAKGIDGYTLIVDPSDNYICYAKKDAQGNLVSSGIKYWGNVKQTNKNRSITIALETQLEKAGISKGLDYTAGQQNKIIELNKALLQSTNEGQLKATLSSAEQAADVVQGNINQVVILIDFPDRNANISLAEVENAYDLQNYNDKRTSIKNWAYVISNQTLNLNTEVIGYYRAPRYTDNYISSSYNFDELRSQALAWADDRFDFSTLTTKNGAALSVMFLYTGDIVGTWANSLWPHAGWTNYSTKDGVLVNRYFLCNLGNSSPISAMKTIRHELGHLVFNWPDTYDYDDDSYSAGGFAMETDIPCAPFRAQHGYINVIDINNKNQSYNLDQAGNTVLKYTNPNNSKEYFMIEYVRKVGWRDNAPDEGLLIWHVDEDGNNNYQDMTFARHYMHSVEQADGLFELERHIQPGSDGDLFHGGFKTTFSNTTIPNSDWWNGSASGLTIIDIGNKGGDNMSLSVGTGGSPTCTAPKNVQISNITSNSAKVSWENSGASSYYIYLMEDGGPAQLIQSDITTTSYTLSDLKANTNYTVDIYSVCPTSNPMVSKTFTTTTTATCTAPINVNISDIAYNSAKVSWENSGASSYYIYLLEEGGSWQLVQSDITATSYTLSDLKANTNYTVDIYSVCSSSYPMVRKTFTTTTTATCTAPINVNISDIAYNSAKVSWENSGASSHYIYLLEEGGSWQLVQSDITATSYILSGLKANTNYTVDVYSVCSSSYPMVRKTFTTVGNQLIPDPNAAQKGASSTLKREIAAIVFPNPAKNKISVEATNIIHKLTIRNVTGTVVQVIEHENITSSIDISDYPTGLYFIQLETIEETSVVKFIKK